MQQGWQRLTQPLWAASYLLAVQGPPGSIARELDDENPVIPLGIDIDRDVATAALLGWSEQGSGLVPSLWTASIDQEEGDWMPYGLAGGLPPSDYPLTDRRASSPEGLYMRLYSGPDPEEGSGRRPGPAWISAAVQVTAEVDRIRVGERVLEVPFHGYVPIVVRDLENAVVTAFGGDGSQLDTFDLSRDAGDLYRELRRRDPDGWPFNIQRSLCHRVLTRNQGGRISGRAQSRGGSGQAADREGAGDDHRLGVTSAVAHIGRLIPVCLPGFGGRDGRRWSREP